MTIMRINLPDDLKDAFEKAFPGESIEAVIERLIRDEVTRRKAASRPSGQGIVEAFKELKAKTTPISSDEIRRLREEGRT